MPTDVQALLARAEKALENTKIDGKSVIPRKPRKKKKGSNQNGKGYIYVPDENGKSVPKSRVEMAIKLGRPLETWESVKFKDGDRYNFDHSNLQLTIKAGTPLEDVPCPCCEDSNLFECMNNYLLKVQASS